MPDWPLIIGSPPITGGLSTTEASAADPDSGGVVATSGGANTKGAYVELLSAANNKHPIHGVILYMQNYPTANNDHLFDLAIGAAASEVVIVDNIIASVLVGAQETHMVFLPIEIPCGVRVAIRHQSRVTTTTVVVSAHFLRGQLLTGRGLNRCITYGASTADSGGVELDPGATAHTLSAWAQIVAAASVPNPIKAMVVGLGSRAPDDVARVSHQGLLSIGIGGAGSEVVLIPACPYFCDSSIDGHQPQHFGPFPVDVPAGTRLSARVQSGTNVTGDRQLDVVLYCFD